MKKRLYPVARHHSVSVEGLEARQLYSTYYMKAISSSSIGIWENATPNDIASPNYAVVATNYNSQFVISDGIATSFTIDETGGQAIPTGGFSLVGKSSTASSNTLLVIGTGAADSATYSNTSFQFSSTAASFSNIGYSYYNPYAGADSIQVTSGTLVLTAGAVGGGIVQRPFSSISISSGAELYVAPPSANHSDRQFLYGPSSGFIINGKLDMTSNDMYISAESLDGLDGNIATGHNLTTSVTALGSAPTTIGASYVHDPTQEGPFGNFVFDGVTFNGNQSAVLVKWTYEGDANLSGFVDGTDQGAYTNGKNNHLKWWENGDFNYDGAINTTDLNLLTTSENTEGTTHL